MDIFDLINPKNPLPSVIMVQAPMGGYWKLTNIYWQENILCGENDEVWCQLDWHMDDDGHKLYRASVTVDKKRIAMANFN